MPWKRILAYVTGEIDESLLLRIEYLLAENRILRNQSEKRVLLTDAERRMLAEKAVALGKLMTRRRRISRHGNAGITFLTPTGFLGGTTSDNCILSLINDDVVIINQA